MRLAILPDSIQNGSPHSWSHPAFFLSCCQMTNRSKPLGPNWTIPKELGGRKACPLQSCYFFLPFSLLSAEHRTSYSLFQVLRKLAALGWWMNALLFQKSLFYTVQRRGRWIFYFRLCVCFILQWNIRPASVVFLSNHLFLQKTKISVPFFWCWKSQCHKVSIVSASNEYPFLIPLYLLQHFCDFPTLNHCEKRQKFELNDLVDPRDRWRA